MIRQVAIPVPAWVESLPPSLVATLVVCFVCAGVAQMVVTHRIRGLLWHWVASVAALIHAWEAAEKEYSRDYRQTCAELELKPFWSAFQIRKKIEEPTKGEPKA